MLRSLARGIAGKPLSTPGPAPVGRRRLRRRRSRRRTRTRWGEGRPFTREDVPLLANAMHWLTGVRWGAVHPFAPVGGLAFGTGVWAAAYAALDS